MSAIAGAEIRTERLLLRPQNPADADAITALAADRDIAATTLSIPHPYTISDARSWIETSLSKRAGGRSFGFAITLAESARLVGAIGLQMDSDPGSAELAYWIGVPYWGQGYATEAARAVTGYGFDSLGLERIYGQHFTENPGSGRVLEKAGLRYEGTLRGHVLKWGERKDIAIYGLLRSDRHKSGSE